MENEQTEIINFFIKLMERRQNYHDHKEKMAWIGTIVYLGFCLTVISYVIANLENIKIIFNCNLGIKISVLFLQLVIFLGAYCYINMQFRRRWYAHDEDVILRRYIQMFLYDNKRLKMFIKENSKIIFINDNYYPEEIQSKMEEFKKNRKISNFCKDDRWKTEIPSYVIIILLFIFKICLLIKIFF